MPYDAYAVRKAERWRDHLAQGGDLPPGTPSGLFLRRGTEVEHCAHPVTWYRFMPGDAHVEEPPVFGGRWQQLFFGVLNRRLADDARAANAAYRWRVAGTGTLAVTDARTVLVTARQEFVEMAHADLRQLRLDPAGLHASWGGEGHLLDLGQATPYVYVVLHHAALGEPPPSLL